MHRITTALFIGFGLIIITILGLNAITAQAQDPASTVQLAGQVFTPTQLLDVSVAGVPEMGVQMGTQFTVQIRVANPTSDTLSLIMYSPVPSGTTVITYSRNLSGWSYILPLEDAPLSVSWTGTLTPSGNVPLSYTVQVDDIEQITPVEARLFNQNGGYEILSQTVSIATAGDPLYLPIALRDVPANATPLPTATNTPMPTMTPTATPTGTQTVTPTTVVLEPVVIANMISDGDVYVEALNGTGSGGVKGQNLISQPVDIFGLAVCEAFGFFSVYRFAFEFDTSGIESGYTQVYLQFIDRPAYPGPPEHNAIVYQGTWGQLLGPNQQIITPTAWSAVGDEIAIVPRNSPDAMITQTVTIAPVYIDLNGTSKFLFRSSTEGSIPGSSSCINIDGTLGGSIASPQLYFEYQ